MRWAERHLRPDLLEALLLPVIGDLQFEYPAAVSGRQRRAARCAAFFTFAEAFIFCALTNGRLPLKQPILPVVRVAMMIPAALLASLGAQLLFGRGAVRLLLSTTGPSPQLTWVSKCLTAPFIAATFICVMSWVAPPIRRRPSRLVGLIVVVVWGALLVYGGFRGGNNWLLAMGLLGWFGGIAAYIATRARAARAL